MKRNIGKRIVKKEKPFDEVELDSKRLLENGDCGLIILLFHISNDLSLNTIFYSQRKANRIGELAEFVFGQELSLMRLTCAQVREVLHVLPKVTKSAYLMSKISGEKEAIASLEYLNEFTPRGANKSDFLKFKKIRDVLTYHYDTCELPRWYIEEFRHRSEIHPSEKLLVPRERQQYCERFCFIDSMNAKIIRTKILESPGDNEEQIDEAVRLTSGVVEKVQSILQPILIGIISDYHI